ncbi:8867_t:CDS:2 [Funneliformis caledonium]|uniref:8867_t:CDS:1 n=1 Tax=Funneliformis caledonium TaxID=1117310 RepID=A0A9N9HLZ6_9GLOM|nr:8867_t:CDS:2 [Funneliformis caledonium]
MLSGACVGIASISAASAEVNVAEFLFAKILLGGTVSSPFGAIFGTITFGLGIWAGSYLLNCGIGLIKVPEILKKLNNIMEKALKAYDEGDHQRFINCFDANKLVETLLSYGFRSDGIAYLLILLGEVLNSGKINIKGKTTRELMPLAKNVLSGLKSKKLEEMAINLDKRIYELQKENNFFETALNKVIDFVSLKEYRNIAKEHMDDAKKSFLSRLEEMRDIADINLAMFDIIDGGIEELERAKKTY